MGSAIFTVKSPTVSEQLWYGNTPVISQSPYVVSYQEADYQRIEKMQHDEEQALNNYLNKQPEIHESAFQTQLQEAKKNNPQQRIFYFAELAKYRLNKKIPSTLTFKERKALLINSQEWTSWIHQHDKHLSADELTENNIQKEIDNIAFCWGIATKQKFQKFEWFPIALNSEICRIYIPN